MNKIHVVPLRAVFVAIILLVFALLPLARLDALTSSSLLLSDPRSTQTGVTYTFNSSGFTTATTIRCVEFILNTAADGSGGVPAGVTTTASTLVSSTVITAGSWTVDNSTNGTLSITNAAGETPAATGNIVWGVVTNGTTEATTYYGIFTTYTDVNCTGGNEVDTKTISYVYTDGELVQLTIDPTLTFTVAGVASGQAINGATTTVASTGTGIDFLNDVTFAAKGVSAHDLQVGTNATGGYTVYVRHTNLLTNGIDTITNHTGTNAAPTAFPVAGTEAWGYTTQDTTLAGGTGNRFNGNLWSGFNTSNEIIADNTVAPTGVETTRVGQQVGVAAGTEAGTYQTTIIYTAASVY
jgi:hypothetical protein